MPRPGGLNQAEEGLREASGSHSTLLDVKCREQGHRGIQHPGHVGQAKEFEPHSVAMGKQWDFFSAGVGWAGLQQHLR